MAKGCQYNYHIINIGDEDGEGYAAVIPKFPNLTIMADTIPELNEQVIYTIEWDIEERKKEGRPIPAPDRKPKFSGKVMLRFNPNLHEKLFLQAKANQVSLNKYITQKLEESCG